MPSSIRFTLLSGLSFATVLLAGCSTSFSPGPVENKVGTLSGRIHGGQQAVSGSKVYLLQAGTTAYGGPGIAAATNNASTSLLSSTGSNTQFDGTNYYVLSQSDGSFTITGDYTCTVGDVVYLYALGGNSGSGTNSNIGLMAILGTCPSGGFASTIPTVMINEVSTVAAAYSMAGFASDATHVSNTGTTLGMTGIQNSFSTAGNLAAISSGTPYATTPNGNGTVPQSEINTLANIISSCVNATDVAFANCTTLFGAATGAANATTPTDTATATINIAHAPVTNVSTLFGLQAGVASPFLPDLSAAPNDFSVSLIFTGGGLAAPTTVTVHDLAVDASGNIWNVVPASNLVTEFSPLGAPLLGTGIATSVANGLSTPVSIALDTASPANIWIVNNAGKTITELNSTGGTVGNYTIYSSGTTNALSGPSDAEFDGSGNLWISNYTTSALVKATTTSTSATFAATATSTTYIKYAEGVAIAAGSAGGVYSGSASSKYSSLYTNADVYSLSVSLSNYADASAIDASGNIWYAENTKDIAKVVPGTTLTKTEYASTQTKDYYYTTYYSVAIDGAGNVFAPDTSNGLIQEYSNAGTNLAGVGYVPAGEPSNYIPNAAAPPTGYVRPFTMVMDGSGNAWYNTLTDATLREVVGIGVPVVTPLAYGVANSMLGTRP